MNNIITVPKCKFNIGNMVTEKNSNDKIEYLIYDISYSIATNEWYYRYSYWMGGYEHYCKSPISYVENLFEKVVK